MRPIQIGLGDLSKKTDLYAAKDVEFLLEIYRLQKKILYKKNKLQDVFKESRKEAKLGNQDLKISRLNRKKINFLREKKIYFFGEKTWQNLKHSNQFFIQR